MPKRTKLPPSPDYIDIGKNPENHMIQKADPLMSLSKTTMTLPELKILDAYLDRINSHDPEKRTVQLEKGKIEEFLGVSRILRPDLEKRLLNLAQAVKIEDESKPNGFKVISLFEEIGAWQDGDGLWQITLTCTPAAREYIFNIENLHYLRYALSDVVNLTSRYSYFLYLYLLKQRFRGSWEVPLDELKDYLRCTAASYTQYKRFNDLVLKKCHHELNKKTSLHYSYVPIKRGRTVKAIQFTVETSAALDILPGQLSLEDLPSNQGTDLIELLRSATTPPGSDEPEFSRAEMEHLFTTLATVSVDKLPQIDDNNIDLRRYHYLTEKYAAMNRQAEKKQIKHRFAYFLSIIKQDF